MNQFMGVMTDPFVAGRGDPASPAARRHRLCRTRTGRVECERATPSCDLSQGAAMADPFTQRWSVWAAGFGGSQTTDGNAALGSNNTTSSISGTAVGADYRFSPYTHGRLCAGRRRHQLQRRQWRLRPLRPVPGRRLHPPHRRSGLSLRRAGLWLAGHHHRPHRHHRRHRSAAGASSTPMPGRAASRAAIASSPVDGGIGMTPYAAGQFTTFDLPAYAESAVVRRQHLCAGLRRQRA